MKSRQQKSNWVSASEVGRAAFCPHYLVLKYRNCTVSHKAKHAQHIGNMGHSQLNKLAKQDKRCFIASHVYGIDDPRTDYLRIWRDRVLLKTIYGQLFITTYYFISPYLVLMCKKYTVLNRFMLSLVNTVIKIVKAREKHNG